MTERPHATFAEFWRLQKLIVRIWWLRLRLWWARQRSRRRPK